VRRREALEFRLGQLAEAGPVDRSGDPGHQESFTATCLMRVYSSIE
jgi:hypothetical protein